MNKISAIELQQRLDAGEQLAILDVREPSEYAELNMGAKLLPLGEIMNGQIDEIEDWKNTEIIVHCRSGKRSMQACMMLEQQFGFTNTVNLEGGIIAWSQLS
jgi:rhodanese-related sulfurtransferase